MVSARIIWAFRSNFVYSPHLRDQETVMKPCWAQYLLWLIIVLAGATAMLSGCGQDGNLYLPDKEQPKDQDD